MWQKVDDSLTVGNDGIDLLTLGSLNDQMELEVTELVADCPRCSSTKITFDVKGENHIGFKYDWQSWFEAYSVCRHCGAGTIFVLSQKEYNDNKFIEKNGLHIDGNINQYFSVESFINRSNNTNEPPSDYLPDNINSAFTEGAQCLAINCFNAAGFMFRLCIDLATKSLLPDEDNENAPNAKVRRNLGLRLPWLFDNGKLPVALKELSECIKDDGNDGVHDGILQKEDAQNLFDFTYILLERLYTEPERLRLAKERRESRRE